MDQALNSQPRSKLGLYITKLFLYLGAACLCLLAWHHSSEKISVRPWVKVLLFGAPLLWLFLLDTLPSLIHRVRLQRLKQLGNSGHIQDPGYFRLSPFTSCKSDRETYNRPDNEHKKVFNWLTHSNERVYFLSGRSGTGKSSLLNAHVLPNLAGPPHFWRILTLQSGADPLAALSGALLEPGNIWENPPTAIKDLNILLARACGQSKYPLLIVWDQFEEFLIHNDQENARLTAFSNFIRRMCQDGPTNLRSVLVFRTDYLQSVFSLNLPALEARKNWEEVSPLLPRDARSFLHASDLGVSHRLLDHLLHEIYEIEETKGLVRPITLNMIGLVLESSTKSERSHLSYEYGILSFMARNLRACLHSPGVRPYISQILKPMLTEDGTKQERSVEELAWESQLSPDIVKGVLVYLANHGLVRRIDPITERWTIAHDFVAKQLDLLLRKWRPHIFRRWSSRLIFTGVLIWTVGLFGIFPLLDASFRDRNIANIVRQGGELITDEKGVAVHFRTHPRLDKTAPFLANLDNFYKLDLSYTQVTDLTALQALPTLRVLKLDGAVNADLQTLENMPQLVELGLAYLPISEIESLQKLTSLQSLDLSGSGVEHIFAISGFPNLRVLQLRDTGLRSKKIKQEDLDFNTMSLQELMRVDVSPENVPYLTELSTAHGLTWLDFKSTYVTSLEQLLVLPNLEGLELARTRVEDLTPLEKLPRIWFLDLRQTRVSDLSPLATLKDLRVLKLSQTKVNDLAPLLNLVRLEELDLARTDVASLAPLTNMNSLKKLNLSYTFVNDIEPLSSLTQLFELDLSGSTVTHLESSHAFEQLRDLNLAETAVVDLSPLTRATALESLSLASTAVSDLTHLYDLRQLRTLNLSGTSIGLEEIKSFRRAQPLVKVIMPN